MGIAVIKEAMLYEKIGDNKVHCKLCAHSCKISQGKRGFAESGKTGTENYILLFMGRFQARRLTLSKKNLFITFIQGLMFILLGQ